MKTKSLRITRNKIISIIMIIIILFTLIIRLFATEVYATNQVRNTDTNNIYNIDESLYPGYAAALQNLKNTHPNWTFTLLYTNLEWRDVLTNEATASHARSLVQGKTGEWLCTDTQCDGIGKDGSSWFHASQVAVSYYLDPRNFLTENKIFQFETLTYVPSIHTEAGVETILKGTFMSNKKVCDYYGNAAYGDKTFAQTIMYAASQSNVSPYHIASRIKQEIGVNGSDSSRGNVSGYEGLFNFFNINATPTPTAENPSGDSVINGLIYARTSGWTTPEIAITEGAKWLASGYIAKGQESLYLQKWDVDDQDFGQYWHQYQTNIQAPTSESSTIYSTYKSMYNNDLTYSSFNFIIPMYKHIPTTVSRYPSNSTYTAQNAQINDTVGFGVRIRKEPAGDTITIERTGYPLLRIELKAANVGGNIWDKVMLSDGTIGYVATQYIIENMSVSELSKEAYINTDTQLLNGPRTVGNGTTAFRQLYTGQAVTILEEGKYTFDGCSWNKVRLQDGTMGYVPNYCTTAGTYGEKVKITCDTELALRDAPSGNLIKWIDIGVIVNRIEKATEKVNGYYWDKVITGDGIVGYMAREKYNPSYLLYLTPVDGGINTSGEKIAVDGTTSTVKTVPNATFADIKAKYSNATLVSGTENLGTGAKINIDGVQYTIVKLGDVNGDGIVDAIDLLKIRKHLLGKETLENEFLKSMDVYVDGTVDAKDLLKVRKVLTKTDTIQM